MTVWYSICYDRIIVKNYNRIETGTYFYKGKEMEDVMHLFYQPLIKKDGSYQAWKYHEKNGLLIKLGKL